MKDWIVKKFLLGYVKGFLDKLPMDGYKTLLSVLLLLITVAIQVLPQYAPFLIPIAELLRPYADVLVDVTLGTAVTGAVHKVLKTAAKE